MRSHFIRKSGKLEEDKEEEEGEGQGRGMRRRRRHSNITYGKSKRSSKEGATVLLAKGRDYKSVGKASLNLNSYQKDTSIMLQFRGLHLIQVNCVFFDEISVPFHLMGLKEVT